MQDSQVGQTDAMKEPSPVKLDRYGIPISLSDGIAIPTETICIDADVEIMSSQDIHPLLKNEAPPNLRPYIFF
jgi:hypothetical protein